MTNELNNLLQNLGTASGFRLLCSGWFVRDRVSVRWLPARPAPPSPVVEQQMFEFWSREIEATGKRDFIFNGKLCCLSAWQVQQDGLLLELHPGDYRELLYSNHVHGQLDPDGQAAFISGTLGVSVVIGTPDQRLILIRRTQRVGEGAGLLDVVGGHIEPDGATQDHPPDPFRAIADEMAEELDLSPGDDSETVCIGLVEATRTSKPELVFLHRTPYTSDAVLQRARRHACPEIADLLAVPDDVGSLVQLLETRHRDFSPAAVGALCLFLQLQEASNPPAEF